MKKWKVSTGYCLFVTIAVFCVLYLAIDRTVTNATKKVGNIYVEDMSDVLLNSFNVTMRMRMDEMSSVENEQALSELYDAEGVVFEKNEDGATALSKFCFGEYVMTACWNVSQEISQVSTVQFDIYPVSFPTEDGSPARLDGGIWGFGVFKSDDERQEACKEFIKYVVTNPSTYRKVVTLSTFWPALITSEDLYKNDVLMQEYGLFTDYMGDYYQVTTNWSKARTAWWQMLQKVGDGENIDECMAWFQQEVE